MNKKLLLLIIILFTAFSVNAAMDPVPAFCQNQGYTLSGGLFSDEPGEPYCVFDDGNRCNAREFFEGKCGQEYVREFPCKELGEIVFYQFEECCEGKAYLPYGYMGQTICEPFEVWFPGTIKRHLLHNPLVWLIELIILILIIYLIIKKLRK